MGIYEIMHEINFPKKGMKSCLPMLLKNQKNMHPLALSPAKCTYHKKFFTEISSIKISFFKSPSHHLPVEKSTIEFRKLFQCFYHCQQVNSD